MKPKIVLKSVLIVTFLFLISCIKTPQEQIIGSWSITKEGAASFVFDENGSVTMDTPLGLVTMNWSIPGEGKLRITNPDDGSQFVDATYMLTGQDTLEINSDSVVTLLTRVDVSA